MAVLVLARFGRSCGIFFASHSSLSPPESFVVRRWRASRFGRGGWFWPNGEFGAETSLAAASSGIEVLSGGFLRVLGSTLGVRRVLSGGGVLFVRQLAV